MALMNEIQKLKKEQKRKDDEQDNKHSNMVGELKDIKQILFSINKNLENIKNIQPNIQLLTSYNSDDKKNDDEKKRKQLLLEEEENMFIPNVDTKGMKMRSNKTRGSVVSSEMSNTLNVLNELDGGK